MLEEFKIVEKEGKEKIAISYNTVFRMLEAVKKRDSLISDSKLFDLLPEDLIVGLLINARYRYENNMEVSVLQDSIRNECGTLGKMYIADLYTRISSSLKEPMEEPFKIMGDLTFEQIEEDYKAILANSPKTKEIK